MSMTYQEFPGVEWIEGAGNFIKVDAKKCDGCGNCWYSCLPDAIQFSWPPGGTGFRTIRG